MKRFESLFFGAFWVFWALWLFLFISLLSIEFVPSFVIHIYSVYFGFVLSEDTYGFLIATLLWLSFILTLIIMTLIYLFFKGADDFY
ncbi:Uncharacterised protein [Yersinia pekkanenii]|uniref:Uncharacterized protein n=1 Tax=Yersinia pekkanenii TaxID=1288385 RepID=A0A0T9RJU2_9GAMM|nr:Uncharacterised protein [Yersinia pekkanenii]CRY69638.1 Uncharacterised protein [Yersinia pekkanenii]